MTSNSQHILELCALYNSTSQIHPRKAHLPAPLTLASSGTSHYKPTTFPLTCCNTVSHGLDDSLVHFFSQHFQLIHEHLHGMESSHLSPSSKGSIVVQQATVFLKQVTLPKNPLHFRPAPLSKSPLAFKNPYSCVYALAYDFMETVKQKPLEYSSFTAKLANFISFSNHLDVWPYWVYFIYPTLLDPITSKGSPEKIPLHSKPIEKVFKSSNPYIPQELSLRFTSRNNIQSFTCPFRPCQNTYTSTPGLRTHLLKYHLQSKHCKEDTLPKNRNIQYKCPIRQCKENFTSESGIRKHLLHIHFGTFYKAQVAGELTADSRRANRTKFY
ncbi:hypothetical protein DSO57_1016303 [Entomophthora muscae]|uniref:Uncharacterized protein n=1 Tax=Entomophthora muscae TaxID=34485 RepID=A0ACC2U3A0_9FUNG|nr:hypothetical protein DSO57_1016303 [Entomophthora muscae]